MTNAHGMTSIIDRLRNPVGIHTGSTKELREEAANFFEVLLRGLHEIHSALDDALGDSDITHLEDDELREAAPVQWAAQRLALLAAPFEATTPDAHGNQDLQAEVVKPLSPQGVAGEGWQAGYRAAQEEAAKILDAEVRFADESLAAVKDRAIVGTFSVSQYWADRKLLGQTYATAIRALSAAPPPPSQREGWPSEEDIARKICCPDGCENPGTSRVLNLCECTASMHLREARAVLSALKRGALPTP